MPALPLAWSALLASLRRRFGAGVAIGALVTVMCLAAMGAWSYWHPLRAFMACALSALGGWIWLRKRGPEHAPAIALLTGITLVFELIVFGFFARVFRNFLTLEELGAQDFGTLRLVLVEQLLRLVFTLCLSLLTLSMTSAALSGIYLGDRAALAVIAPRHWLNAFAGRFIPTATSVAYMVAGLLVPALLALGWRFGAAPLFYWLLAPALLLLFLPPLTLGAALTALLIRIFPVHRLQQALSVITVAGIAALVIAVRAASPEKLYNPDSSADLAEIARSLNIGGLDKLPGAWVARLLVQALDGRFSSQAALPLALTGAGAALAWVALAHTHARLRARAEERTGELRVTSGWWPRGTGALLWFKDARLFTRDAKEWSQVVMLAALVIVYLYNIRLMPAETPVFRNVIVFLNLVTLGFILAALNMRFTFPAMALEGPGVWCLLKSPVSRMSILREKMLFTFIPLSGFALLLTWLAGRLMHLEPALLGVNMALGALFAVTLHWMAFAFGLAQYRPPESDPVRMALSPGGIAYMVCGLVYVGAGLALAARTIYELLRGGGLVRLELLWGYAALSLLIILLCELSARRRMAALEW